MSGATGVRRVIGFDTPGEGMAALGSEIFDSAEEGKPGMGKTGLGTVHQPQTTRDFKFGDSDLHEVAASQFGLDGEARHQSNTVAEGDEALDGFEAGQLHAHVQRCLVASEGFDHALTKGRGNRVGDEILCAEFADGNLPPFGKWMGRIDDEGDGIRIYGNRAKAGILGTEREDAKLAGALEQLIGDAAGEGTLDGDADVRADAAEGVQHREKPEAGVFIGDHGEAATLEGAQLLKGDDGFSAQAEETFRIAAQQLAGGGQGAFARGALEERLADFLFELADGVADGGLGAVQSQGGAGKALLFNDGEKGFELVEVHK